MKVLLVNVLFFQDKIFRKMNGNLLVEDPRHSFLSPRPVNVGTTPYPTPQTIGSIPEDLGTTIMAVEFDGGVVMGADSRTSSGKLSFVTSKKMSKGPFLIFLFQETIALTE